MLELQENPYLTRVAGAARLADLAAEDPQHSDQRVMRVFEAFLAHPPQYGQNRQDERKGVDYTSRDTVTIVDAIKNRSRQCRDKYTLSLPPDGPFIIDSYGNAVRNPDWRD